MLSGAAHTLDHFTIADNVRTVTLETFESSNGVDSRRVGRGSHFILYNTITK